ncbi:portal_HK97, phage portal protein, HK97 family [uncultured Caudovirales phage]|uniref:Portal_HK97, phage portal protein, HK97 family n=1 Tax=uncultured Caudovirales phage TaxID=2100421 RepID=A0A6J5T2V1_9CAUD|nr:portal_HK97, phage portal protein, HK97 family [uncultured Caudovirales phage]
MGLFTRSVDAVSPVAYDVQASLAPVQTQDSIFNFFGAGMTATRAEAMSVPTVARARNIITSSVASIPLKVRTKADGMEVENPTRVINQPDPRVPGSATYAFLCEDLLFYGFAYLRTLEIYADTYRIRSAERINPIRITVETNSMGTEIEGYRVDGRLCPSEGVGSLSIFYGNDEGLLNRAGRTIKAGAELERAATMYAKEPVPTMVLKSNGTALPADRIAKLLESWGAARRNRATAFLNADVTLETLGFDPEKLQLNQARSYVSTELARAVGVPAFFVDAETGSSMTYSNANLSRSSLVDFSLRPMMTSIEERLSMTGMPNDFVAASQEVKFDLDDYLRGSALERAQIYKLLFDMGVLTTDEIRMKEDMAL